MNRFFNSDDETWSHEAEELARRVEKEAIKIINEYRAKGYAIREIEYVLLNAVGSAALCSIMEARMERKNQK